jgi:hypothetical protein
MASPVKTWRNGKMDIAAWEGKFGHTFTFRKTYKDKETGAWKEAKTLFKEDLFKLAEMLGEIQAWANGEIQEVHEPVTEAPAVDLTDLDVPF